MASDYIFKKWDGEAGGNRLFWLSKLEIIAEMVNRYDLSPISEELIPAGAYAAPAQIFSEARSLDAAKIPIRWPCGGIKEPHLHYGQKLFMLDQKQWQEFSNMVVKDCTQRLASAESINITQLIDISESIAKLPSRK